MRLTDSEILDNYFRIAQRQATKEEKDKIQLYREALKESPDSPEIVDICLEFYQEIHHLITRK